MRAIILAAGRGSRMGQATENSHKCLTILNGKPLLQWQLKAIKESNVDNITVVTGYRNDLLNGEFKKIINERWAETNMVASLFCNEDYEGDTIISYSDIVYKSDHIANLINGKGEINILADLNWKSLWELRFENPLDDAETFKSIDGKLLEIGGKTNSINDIQAQYMGLIKVTKEGWRKMKKYYDNLSNIQRDKLDMTSLLAGLLKDRVDINATFINGGWCEVDNFTDVVLYEKMLTENTNWSHKWF